VSNLNSFNLLNMYLEVDGRRLSGKRCEHFRQADMRHARSPPHLRFTPTRPPSATPAGRSAPAALHGMLDVSVVAKKDVNVTAASVMDAPDALREVQNFLQRNRPAARHTSLLTSAGPRAVRQAVPCAFQQLFVYERTGREPKVIHEMWTATCT
jgi:hypothetical protein